MVSATSYEYSKRQSVSMFDLYKFCLDAHGLIADVELKPKRYSDCLPIVRQFDVSFQRLLGKYFLKKWVKQNDQSL